jgi:glycosyltransferase involved in cell wall biosynthesis
VRLDKAFMKKTLRILFVANSNEIGGGNRSLETLSLGLRHVGHVPIMVFPSEGPAPDLFREHGFNVIIMPLIQPSINKPLVSLDSILNWRRLLRNNQIDIAHANGTLAARSITIATKINNTPLICHLRFDFGKSYYKWAFKALPSPSTFIFVSENMRLNIESALIKCSPQASFHVVHNAVILSKKAIQPVAKLVSRIGIIANLQKIKGHEDFLNMAQRLLKHHPNLHFDIIGSDVQNEGRETHLKQIVIEKMLENNVTFHGHVSDVYNVIDDLDLVICPSHEEPFGRCAIEAMSRGKPVIVTNVGGLPEIVEQGINGIIVPPKDISALVNATLTLLEENDVRQTMASNNIQKVETFFTQKGHTEKICQLYEEQL